MRYKFFPLLFAAIFFLTGYIIMFLWNAILPAITTARPVTYWQAMGLLILCRLLFGGLKAPGRPGRPFGERHNSAHWREKWSNMTEEERNNLRKKWMGSDDEKKC